MTNGSSGGFVGVVGRIRAWLVGFILWALLLDYMNFSWSGDASKSGIVWSRQAGVFALYFVVVSILRTLWPMRVSRSNTHKLIAGGKTHGVHTFTGQTHSASVSHLSTTTGSGSIYSTYPGNVSGNIHISTRIDRLDRFSLSNAAGQQHTVEVKNANVPIGEGQWLTAAWAIPFGNKTGHYVAFVNHSTGDTTWPRLHLARMAMGARPGVSVLWAVAAAVLLTIGGYSTGIAAFFVCLFCLAIVSRLQARLFSSVTGVPLIAMMKADGAAALAVANRAVSTPQAAAAAPAAQPQSAPLPPPPPPAPVAPSVPAGWHADPHHRHEHRYWDGSQWTEHVSDAGVTSLDPS